MNYKLFVCCLFCHALTARTSPMEPVTSWLNVVLSATLLLWPSSTPTLSCPGPVVTEIVPQALTRAMEFSQKMAEDCSQERSLSVSGFWFGFFCGCCVMLIATMISYDIYRAILRVAPACSPARSITAENLRQARALPAPAEEPKPATPADLRALGLI